MHQLITSKLVEINIPMKWEEVTASQFIRIKRLKPEQNEIDLIQAVTGMERNILKHLTLDEVDNLVDVLSFISDQTIDPKNYPMPKELVIDGKTISMPINISKEEWIQRVYFEMAVIPEANKNDGVITESICHAVAVYVQPKLTGKAFDDESLAPIIEMVGNLPVVQVYPIAYFFLSECNSWLLRRKNGSKAKALQRSKKEPALVESKVSES